ncbi:MAG: hydantoinase B/oxoprolinase family protein [Gammaproteobacteria bacterium]
MEKWRFWIDRGGTFTDIIGVAPDGKLRMDKRPSSDEDGGLAAARDMMNLPKGARLPASRVAEIRIGTTIATNALLERKGDKTAIAVTRGFADALQIGDQTRPHLFSLDCRRAPPLWFAAVEIDERIGADGKTVRPLDEAAAKKSFQKIAKSGARALAIALMHGASYPRHEKRLLQIAKAAGIPRAVASHQSAQLIKYIPRAHTAAADAYLDSGLKQFAAALRARCENGIRLLFMQSGGALAEASSLRAVNTVLSGPAGGAVGAQKSAARAGFSRVISFDMGGTSTDVALAGGDAGMEVRMENEVAGVLLFAPMLDIRTVAAGGGSIVRCADKRLLAGPHSAGANPGPACYGFGGPLTITDCNVMLGKLRARFFPRIFGKSRREPLDEKIVRQKFAALQNETGMAAAALAEGFVRVAVENMAGAVRRIAAARGADIGAHIINSFGGAAGQHVCLVAEAAGTKTAIAPRYAPALSAWGIGCADIGARKRRSAECALSSPKLRRMFAPLEKLAASGLPTGKLILTRRVLCRYAGMESAIPVLFHDSPRRMRAAFEQKHRKLFGFCDPEREVIAAAAEAEAVLRARPPPPQAAPAAGQSPRLAAYSAVFGGRRRRAVFYDWNKLAPDAAVHGPAVIVDKWNTVVVEPGWRAEVKKECLLLRRMEKTRAAKWKQSTAAALEIFNHRFAAVAEQMGETLRRTAVSVNIRERLDFSCALFDRRGNLVANAPHIPVHLGSMSGSVRYAIRAAPPEALRRGDMILLNSPYCGGTHLPDLTLVKAGRLDGKPGAPEYFTAARGHHADIGGISPGSMPAASAHIDEEGVLIPPCIAVSRGRLREAEILQMLGGAKYPARNPRQNIADLRAQAAALSAGDAEMRRAAADFGADALLQYMRRVQNNAARACRRLLGELKPGSAEVVFDSGAVIKTAVDFRGNRAVFDFTGTSPAQRLNFNAPKPVLHAAVIYCLRVMLGEDMPLNDGIMRPVKLIAPPGSMINPRPPAAVAAGNVEVSQHIADAVFAALGVCAHAQGTCNNFTLGCGGMQYYETICGGGGGGKDFCGSDAMQTHMTNSRASDPEILETHYPLRLEHFGFRQNSGGAGKHRGGMGAIRRVRFLQNGEAAILSSRRKIAPRGACGGLDGMPGKNAVIRKNGKRETLSGCAQTKMQAGDVFIIETPGGGGWGKPEKPRAKKKPPRR